MNHNYWFYLKNIFVNPVRAARGVSSASNLTPISLISYAIGVSVYIAIVLMQYNAIGWSAFPYTDYYPHYFSPYWWEVFVVPAWGLVIAFGFGISCYLMGRLSGGKGTFSQVMAFVLLASVVSLPIMVIVDIVRVVWYPEWVVGFAKYGQSFKPDYPGTLVKIIDVSYVYVAMTWQGIVTVIGLAVIHRTAWYKHIPGIVIGMGIFFGFLLLIRDYVALII